MHLSLFAVSICAYLREKNAHCCFLSEPICVCLRPKMLSAAVADFDWPFMHSSYKSICGNICESAGKK